MRQKRKKKINYDNITKRRFIGFFVVIIILFLVVTIKIGSIMISKEKYYDQKLKALTYSTVSGVSSPRGRIYDRYYRILVDNKSLKTITYQKPKKTTES